jgi:hypothetical protein
MFFESEDVMKMLGLLSGTVLAAAVGLTLGGCESVAPVPSSAMQVSSGEGAVSYRTADPGQIYVYDKTWNQLAYTGQVKANQLVAVDPGAGKVTIDGTIVVQKPLGGGDKFDIYLDKSAAMGSTTVEKTTVTHTVDNQ